MTVSSGPRTTFGLIHGAHHGAWQWDLLVPELHSRGHDAIAVDLPIDDPGAGIEEYAHAVRGALAGANGDVTLVAHSLGGIVAPVVAAHRPVGRIVFLAAVIPQPGRTLAEQLAADPLSRPGVRIDSGDGTEVRPADEAIERYYHDVPPDLQRWAAARLRPQATRPRLEPCPLERWPAVPCTYVVCVDDRAMDPARSRRAARDLLGLEAVEIPGSHSPFLARPAQLADILVAAVT